MDNESNQDIINSKEFNSNDDMIDWINENSNKINILQVYSSIKRNWIELRGNYEYGSIFHVMYKNKNKRII